MSRVKIESAGDGISLALLFIIENEGLFLLSLFSLVFLYFLILVLLPLLVFLIFLTLIFLTHYNLLS